MNKRYDILRPRRRGVQARSATARSVRRAEGLYRRLLRGHGLQAGAFAPIDLAYLSGQTPPSARRQSAPVARPLAQTVIHRHHYAISMRLQTLLYNIGGGFAREGGGPVVQASRSERSPGARTAEVGRIDLLLRRMPGVSSIEEAPPGDPAPGSEEVQVERRVRDLITESGRDRILAHPENQSEALPGGRPAVRGSENVLRAPRLQRATGRLAAPSPRRRAGSRDDASLVHARESDLSGPALLSPVAPPADRTSQAASPSAASPSGVPASHGRRVRAALIHRRSAAAQASDESNDSGDGVPANERSTVRARVNPPAVAPARLDPASPEFKSAIKTALESMSSYDFKPLARKVILQIEKQVARERDRRGLR